MRPRVFVSHGYRQIRDRLPSAHVQLFNAFAIVSFTQWEKAHMAAPSWMLFMSQASLNVAKSPTIDHRFFGLKKGAFVCSFISISSLTT